MALTPVLASLHFRVISAGQAAEQAIVYLNQREVFRGRMAVQSVVYNLVIAANQLKASGQYPDQLTYVNQLVQFYTAQMNSILRPNAAPAVATAIAANQANLLTAGGV